MSDLLKNQRNLFVAIFSGMMLMVSNRIQILSMKAQAACDELIQVKDISSRTA